MLVIRKAQPQANYNKQVYPTYIHHRSLSVVLRGRFDHCAAQNAFEYHAGPIERYIFQHKQYHTPLLSMVDPPDRTTIIPPAFKVRKIYLNPTGRCLWRVASDDENFNAVVLELLRATSYRQAVMRCFIGRMRTFVAQLAVDSVFSRGPGYPLVRYVTCNIDGYCV